MKWEPRCRFGANLCADNFTIKLPELHGQPFVLYCGVEKIAEDVSPQVLKRKAKSLHDNRENN